MSGIRSALVYIYFRLEDHHVRRKDYGYIGRRMLMMELPGKRTRRRPKKEVYGSSEGGHG